MGSLKDLAKECDRLSKEIPVNVDKGFRRTVLVIDQIVVSGTPVDTGRARSNWIVGDGPSEKVIDAYVPGKGKATGAANTRAAINQAKEFMKGKRLRKVYISNNLGYIEYLNQGSSAQAPAGFIEEAVNLGIAEAKKIKATKKDTSQDG